MSIEKIVLSQLLYNEAYVRKVLPYIENGYFQSYSQKLIFEKIEEYFTKYNRLPTKKEIAIEIEQKPNIGEDTFKETIGFLKELEKNEVVGEEWLLQTTEKFCQDKALYNAILKAIEVADNKSNDISRGSIPNILQDALAVSFDTSIGHDYLEDAEDRWEFYHKLEKKIPFGLYWLDKITKGGISGGQMLCGLAPTGGGKSMLMCHAAATNLSMGYNVLYITMEMSEEQISKRIDANLLDIEISRLENVPKDEYVTKFEKLKSKFSGKIIVKGFPNGSAGAANFRYLLNELKLKKKFIPDIIYVDYINICCSNRLKRSNSNSYEYIKSIAEELRSLCQEFNLPLITCTQTNREGMNVSDIDITNTSESIGLPQTTDYLIAFVQPPDMVELNQYLFMQLKNRYNDVNEPKKFVIGVDKPKMRFYDTEMASQSKIDGGPKIEKERSFEGFT